LQRWAGAQAEPFLEEVETGVTADAERGAGHYHRGHLVVQMLAQGRPHIDGSTGQFNALVSPLEDIDPVNLSFQRLSQPLFDTQGQAACAVGYSNKLDLLFLIKVFRYSIETSTEFFPVLRKECLAQC